MECPKCCFSELDRMVKYNRNLETFQVRLGCPRCKTIWTGTLIEEIDDEAAEQAKYYTSIHKEKTDGVGQ